MPACVSDRVEMRICRDKHSSKSGKIETVLSDANVPGSSMCVMDDFRETQWHAFLHPLSRAKETICRCLETNCNL